jgi:hypothetical protein
MHIREGYGLKLPRGCSLGWKEIVIRRDFIHPQYLTDNVLWRNFILFNWADNEINLIISQL